MRCLQLEQRDDAKTDVHAATAGLMSIGSQRLHVSASLREQHHGPNSTDISKEICSKFAQYSAGTGSIFMPIYSALYTVGTNRGSGVRRT